jgi:hypothetical protein
MGQSSVDIEIADDSRHPSKLHGTQVSNSEHGRPGSIEPDFYQAIYTSKAVDRTNVQYRNWT